MSFPTGNNWFKKIIKDGLANTAAIDFDSDAWKAILFTNAITGTFAFDTDQGYSSAPWATTNEIVGTAYTAGGAAITSPTLTVVSGVVTFDGADVSWPTSTITNAQGVLVHDSTLSYSLGSVNFGSPLSSSAGTFSIVWHSAGIFTIS